MQKIVRTGFVKKLTTRKATAVQAIASRLLSRTEALSTMWEIATEALGTDENLEDCDFWNKRVNFCTQEARGLREKR